MSQKGKKNMRNYRVAEKVRQPPNIYISHSFFFFPLHSQLQQEADAQLEYSPALLHAGITMWLEVECRHAFFPVSYLPLTGVYYRTPPKIGEGGTKGYKTPRPLVHSSEEIHLQTQNTCTGLLPTSFIMISQHLFGGLFVQ